MPTMDSILTRVQSNPITHLSCRSLNALEGYIIGYYQACDVWSVPQPVEEIDRDDLFRWLCSQIETTSEHAGRLNAFNWLNIIPWAHFLSADDREAFDTYFELRAQAPRTAKPTVLVRETSANPVPRETLLDTLQRIRERPAMYFGNRFQPLQLWSFSCGFYWAEQDNEIKSSLSEPLFTSFPIWLATRYPFSQGVPWHRLFDALGLSSPLWAFDCFIEHLGLFLSGKPSDTPDSTMQCILENILRRDDFDGETE